MSETPHCPRCGSSTTQYHDASGQAVPGEGVCERCRILVSLTPTEDTSREP